jgi:hypothetical protein
VFSLLRFLHDGLRKKFTTSDIRELELEAPRMLTKMELAYPIANSRFVYHLLLHMASDIRRRGPLWAHWLYANERMGGKLVKLAKTPKSFIVSLSKEYNLTELVESLTSLSPSTFSSKTKKMKALASGEPHLLPPYMSSRPIVRVKGEGVTKKFSSSESASMRRFYSRYFPNFSDLSSEHEVLYQYKSFTTMYINDVMFRVSDLDQHRKRSNNVVKVKVTVGDEEVYNYGLLTKIIKYRPFGTDVPVRSTLLIECEWFDNMTECSQTKLQRVKRPVKRHVDYWFVSNIILTNCVLVSAGHESDVRTYNWMFVLDLDKRFH